jgi:hypothetical protein
MAMKLARRLRLGNPRSCRKPARQAVRKGGSASGSVTALKAAFIGALAAVTVSVVSIAGAVWLQNRQLAAAERAAEQELARTAYVQFIQAADKVWETKGANPTHVDALHGSVLRLALVGRDDDMWRSAMSLEGDILIYRLAPSVERRAAITDGLVEFLLQARTDVQTY